VVVVQSRRRRREECLCRVGREEIFKYSEEYKNQGKGG
jgi:hypothetical protein